MESLTDRLIRHEGFCAVPKYDAKGYYEIGFGHDITEKECENYADGITTAQALEFLQADLAKCKQQAKSAFPWLLGLDDLRQGIIYEMVYQMGVHGVAAFHDMISAIRDHDWESASKEMLNSVWHKETSVRCEELAELMLNGEEA